MNKQQRNKLIGQVLVLVVLVLAILFMLTSGGGSSSGDTGEPSAQTGTNLDLPDIPEVPSSIGANKDQVLAEIEERETDRIKLDSFEGPNQNIFKPNQ